MARGFRSNAVMGPLSLFLERIKELRTEWQLTVRPEPRGEEQPLWFRGHTDANWKLMPKLYRKEYGDADESEIRNEFQSRALQLIQGRMPASKWEWYFLMQHYGVPTRLLDWTENALIALYFAVEDHPGTCDAAVWVLDPAWLNRQLRKGIEGAMLPDWSEAEPYLRDLEAAFEGSSVRVGLPAAMEPPHVDRRLAADRPQTMRLCEEGGESGQDVVEDGGREGFELAGFAGGEAEGAGLVTADDAGGARAGGGQGDGKTGVTDERAAGGDGDDDGDARHGVEAVRRNDQDGASSLLLVSEGGIERDKVDVAALHSSRPTGGRSSQARSGLARAARRPHCASNSSRVYVGLVRG